ncbi:hypothetical protein HWV62_34925 [Athelia sp. TMB]|nr:hypothetical protein HWV62_34925 [Athelia sp. TMB]
MVLSKDAESFLQKDLSWYRESGGWLLSDIQNLPEKYRLCTTPEEGHRLQRLWKQLQLEKSENTLGKRNVVSSGNVAQRFGLGEELEIMGYADWSDFARLKLVNKPTELTQSEWKRIQPKLVQYVESHKEQRLEKKRQDDYRNRFRVIANAVWLDNDTAAFPISPVDICILPEVRELIDLTIDDFDASYFKNQVASVLPDACNFWRDALETRLMAYARKSVECSPDVDPLTLPATIFYCSACKHGLEDHSLKVLSHSCLNRSSRGLRHLRVKVEEDPKPKTKRKHKARPLPLPPFTFEETVQAEFVAHFVRMELLSLETYAPVIGRIFRLCERDPKSATCEDMDQCRVWFSCESCQFDKRGTKNLYPWSSAIIHTLRHSVEDFAQNPWKRASKGESDTADDMESTRRAISAYESAPEWLNMPKVMLVDTSVTVMWFSVSETDKMLEEGSILRCSFKSLA